MTDTNDAQVKSSLIMSFHEDLPQQEPEQDTLADELSAAIEESSIIAKDQSCTQEEAEQIGVYADTIRELQTQLFKSLTPETSRDKKQSVAIDILDSLLLEYSAPAHLIFKDKKIITADETEIILNRILSPEFIELLELDVAEDENQPLIVIYRSTLSSTLEMISDEETEEASKLKEKIHDIEASIQEKYGWKCLNDMELTSEMLNQLRPTFHDT